MTRRGSALALALVATAVALLGAEAVMEATAARRQAAQRHHQRVQARELALGALTLTPGTTLEVAGWRIARTATGATALGHGLRLDLATDGTATWGRP
jgi:hypothetical protein